MPTNYYGNLNFNIMFKNWKTSSTGIGAIVCGIGCILKGDLTGGITAIITGIGLLGAKDHNN